jgi:hypothetical protein
MLIRRRWFGVSVAITLMLVMSTLFSLTFRDFTLSQRLDIVAKQLWGPLPSVGALARHPQFPWSFTVPACSVAGLIAHPIIPRWWSLFLTLVGGLFWWIYGWFSIVAGI